jgi:O-antigen/teichoic acid export membrane protein
MRILTNAVWLSLFRIGADLAGFVLFVSISRNFGPSGIGQYSYAFALASLVAFAAGAGIDEFGTLQYVRGKSSAERLEHWNDIVSTQIVQLGLSAALFTLFWALGGVHGRVSIVLELSGLLVAQYVGRTLFVPAMASQAMILPGLIEFLSRFSAVTVAVALVLTGSDLPLALVGFPAAGALLIYLATRNARAHDAPLRVHSCSARIRNTLRATLPFTAAELLSQFYARADILLIAYFLGNSGVGIYATDVKFVEFGILPLFLLGTAAYPTMSRAAAFDSVNFNQTSREFISVVVFLGGWLSVGIFCLLPLILVPVFGSRFQAAIALLPWFAALALLKSVDAALYRVVYALRRAPTYLFAILIATAVLIAANFILIPTNGLPGAISAALAGVATLICICAWKTRDFLPPAILLQILGRAILALSITFAIALAFKHWVTVPWISAVVACLVYPLTGLALRLVPNPRHSTLFGLQASSARVTDSSN